MRRFFIIAVATVGFASLGPSAHAIGCLSGGAAGALAGHMAGHGVLGAIGGCIAGHEWRKHRMRQEDLQDQGAYEQRRRQYDPGYRSPW